jgi:hypothetical protein
MRLRAYSTPSYVYFMRTACALMVMPRSFSMSMRSRYCVALSRAVSRPVNSIKRSASVLLPWSMWAMMQKLRMSAARARGVLEAAG